MLLVSWEYCWQMEITFDLPSTQNMRISHKTNINPTMTPLSKVKAQPSAISRPHPSILQSARQQTLLIRMAFLGAKSLSRDSPAACPNTEVLSQAPINSGILRRRLADSGQHEAKQQRSLTLAQCSLWHCIYHLTSREDKRQSGPPASSIVIFKKLMKALVVIWPKVGE